MDAWTVIGDEDQEQPEAKKFGSDDQLKKVDGGYGSVWPTIFLAGRYRFSLHSEETIQHKTMPSIGKEEKVRSKAQERHKRSKAWASVREVVFSRCLW